MIGYNPYSLEGKTILITGASSGIGRSTAIECARMGAKCIITGRDEQRLDETFVQLEGEGHQQVIADLSKEEDIDKLVDFVPFLDGLVNNAGFTNTATIPFIKNDVLDKMLTVNTNAPIILLAKLVKKKKIYKGSSVVFTCSMSALGRARYGNSMYAATKGAIYSFVKAAANELADKKIRVNSVCPAMVETHIMEKSAITQEQFEIDKLRYPLKRYGKPEEVAWAIIYLLSDATAWITGTDIVLDGGMRLK